MGMAAVCRGAYGNYGKDALVTKHPGVRLRKHGLWQARITVAGRERFLGSFRTQSEAIAARKGAEIRFGKATLPEAPQNGYIAQKRMNTG